MSMTFREVVRLLTLLPMASISLLAGPPAEETRVCFRGPEAVTICFEPSAAPARSSGEEWRRGRLESKTLLRKYMYGKIPTEILNRKKLGFPVPAYALASKKYRDYLFDVLSAGNRFYERFFDRTKILALYDSETPGKDSEAKHFLWCLAGFERWYEERKECLG